MKPQAGKEPPSPGPCAAGGLMQLCDPFLPPWFQGLASTGPGRRPSSRFGRRGSWLPLTPEKSTTTAKCLLVTANLRLPQSQGTQARRTGRSGQLVPRRRQHLKTSTGRAQSLRKQQRSEAAVRGAATPAGLVDRGGRHCCHHHFSACVAGHCLAGELLPARSQPKMHVAAPALPDCLGDCPLPPCAAEQAWNWC